jgi:hypothetical protein
LVWCSPRKSWCCRRDFLCANMSCVECIPPAPVNTEVLGIIEPQKILITNLKKRRFDGLFVICKKFVIP